MSRLALLCSVLAYALIGAVTQVSAVDCPDANYALASQADVNALGALSCDTVTGNVDINGADITDLTSLSGITTIAGYLYIGNLNPGLNANLQNLDGLSGITSVGSFLSVTNNPVLTNIDGLANVQSVVSLYVSGNTVLQDLDGLSGIVGDVGLDLLIYENPLIQNLAGLAGITAGATRRLQIFTNASLANLDGLSNLSGNIGDLFIFDNQNLDNLDGLSGITGITGGPGVGGSLNVQRNPLITDLAGLSSIAGSIPGDLIVFGNNSLNDIDHLVGITSVGGNISVQLNAITSLNGLASVTGTVGGFLALFGNANLTDISGLSGITGVNGDLTVQNNTALTECQSLATVLGAPDGPPQDNVGGAISISNNGSGCSSVEEVLAAIEEDAGSQGLPIWLIYETTKE